MQEALKHCIIFKSICWFVLTPVSCLGSRIAEQNVTPIMIGISMTETPSQIAKKVERQLFFKKMKAANPSLSKDEIRDAWIASDRKSAQEEVRDVLIAAKKAGYEVDVAS